MSHIRKYITKGTENQSPMKKIMEVLFMKNNNKGYVSPEMENISFDAKDIITTSGDSIPTGDTELPFIPMK